MPRLAASLSDSQYDWVESESESRGVSMAQVIRELIDAERGDGSLYDSSEESESLDASDDSSVIHRLEELETRIDALKGDEDSDGDPEPRGGMADATISTGRGARTREEAKQEPDPQPADPHALVEDYDVPGLGEETQASRRRALRAVVDELEDGPAQRGDYEERVFPDHGGGYDSFDSWWTNLVHPFLKDALDAGAINRYDDGEDRHQYYLPGNGPREAEGDVYDPTDEFEA